MGLSLLGGCESLVSAHKPMPPPPASPSRPFPSLPSIRQHAHLILFLSPFSPLPPRIPRLLTHDSQTLIFHTLLSTATFLLGHYNDFLPLGPCSLQRRLLVCP
ncbi:hypothetical protein E2C01_067656 [Portunus trituberculatus]|uniref:Uncharacterized protein n=1 Tax=Portunus trituberculatus TaxID=210409 RepID=A0A5B7HKD5_PORTR|nr:hypothetical protein [Portunus trituberculatus]